MSHTAVLLLALGGPDCVENVEPYLLDVRGGRPTPANLIEEIRERYRLTGGRSPVLIIFTAHSLPERILQTNDPYPEQVQGTMQAVCARLGAVNARFAYQSQGHSGEQWLGPTVESTIEALHREGHRHVLIAPI